MTTLAAVGRRVLPRGWGDLAKQLAIWFGFLFAYQAARGIADRNPPKAFDNGLKVIGLERHMHGLVELSFQRFVDSSRFLMNRASWPYWNSEFSVMATGNHFWLDVLAGVFVALLSLGIVYGRPLRRIRLRPSAA